MKEKERLKAELAKTKKANAALKKSSTKKEGSSSKKKLIVNLNVDDD